MISANELRIGNYVYPNYENATPYPVLAIGKDSFVCCWENNIGEIEYVLYDDAQPILLTPEILEKCGFKLVSKHSFWNFQNKNGFYVSMWMEDEPIAGFEKKGCCYVGESYTEISTVHWLQNYYFFNYRKELEINLNN
jgi:hypothetical protein